MATATRGHKNLQEGSKLIPKWSFWPHCCEFSLILRTEKEETRVKTPCIFFGVKSTKEYITGMAYRLTVMDQVEAVASGSLEYLIENNSTGPQPSKKEFHS